MKTIEEKAKAYDEALKVLHKYDGANIMFTQDLKEEMFPELKENEDERIRKELLAWLKSRDGQTLPIDKYNAAIAWLDKQGEQNTSFSDVQTYLKGVDRVQSYSELSEYEKIFDRIADTYAHRKNKEGYNEVWYVKERAAEMLYHAKKEIEKQGEQKPFDYENANIQQKDFTPKGEPKYKIGDWITNGIDFTFQVRSIEDDMYLRSDDYSIDIETADKTFRLWTIQDAKDGDILACNNDILSICIFSRFDGINNKYDSFLCRCGLEGEGLGQELNIYGYHDDSTGYVPATKEQRDLLFQKMKEAGYEFDAEKKELKKIEQTLSEEDELSCFESALFTAFSDAWQSYLQGEQVNVKQWAKEHSKELLEAAKEELKEQKPADKLSAVDELLDSLQKEQDLRCGECAKKSYDKGYFDGHIHDGDRIVHVDGRKVNVSRFRRVAKPLEAPVSEDLEKELSAYVNSKEYTNSIGTSGLLLIARHFANWQKQQDQSTIELAEDHAMLAGMEKMKEEMMAKAIDGNVLINGMGNPILHLWDKGKHLIDKKVKVIVIKED